MYNKSIWEPDYYFRFHCLAERCPANCCSGNWRIHIDRATFEKYAGSPCAPFLLQHVKIAPHSTDDEHFATIEVGQHSDCPFLSGTRSCLLQKKLGEAYLSRACRTYPRRAVLLGETLERSLDLSCPEAARLALFSPQPVCFRKIPSSEKEAELLLAGPAKAAGPDCLDRLKRYLLAILQDTNIELGQRLFHVGCILQEIDQTSLFRQSLSIDALIREPVPDWAERAAAAKSSCRKEIADFIQFASEIANLSSISSTWPDYQKLVEKVMAGLGLDWRTSRIRIGETVKDCYREANREYVRPFLREHPFLLENAVACSFFANFPKPVTEEHGLLRQYSELVVIFALTQFFLAGLAVSGRGLSEEEVSLAVAQIFRNLAHNHTTFTLLLSRLEQRNGLNMDFLAKFIFAADPGTI